MTIYTNLFLRQLVRAGALRYKPSAGFTIALLLFMGSFSFKVMSAPPSVGCAVQGPTPVSTYSSNIYFLSGTTCVNAANWTTTCGSIVVGSNDGTEVEVYFNNPGCSSAVIKALNSSGGTIASMTVTINSYPALSGGTISNTSQAINYNTTPALISAGTAGNGAPCGNSFSYQWWSSTDNSNFFAISGATGQNYQPGNLTTTTYYRRSVSCGYQSANSNVATVTVYPPLVAGSAGPSSQTVNYGSAPSALSVSGASGGSGTYSYQWQSSGAVGGPYSGISGATGTSYSPGALTSTTYYNVVTTSNGASATSPAVTVNVYPQLQGGSVSPSAPFVNNNTSPGQLSLGGVSGGSGSYSYQWQSAPDNASWSNVSGATGSTYTPPALTSTIYYRVVVNSNGASVGSASSKVTVYPVLQVGSINPTSQTIAINTSPSTMLDDSVFGGSGSYSYQWQSAPDGSSWSNISGATGISYLAGSLSSTTYYRLVVTSNGVSAATSSVIVYVLQPGSISPATLSINNNTSPGQLSLTGVSGGNGSFSYQWQSSPTNTFTSPTNVGTNATAYTPGNLSSLTYYRVGVTSNGFTAYSGISTINVYPALQPGTIGPVSQTINYNSLAALVSVSGVSGGNGAYTYQWQSSASSGGPFTAISGAVGTGFRDDTGLTSTIYYRLLVTSNGVSIPTNTVVVNVYPQLQTGSVGPAAASINYNTSPGQLSLTGVSGGSGTYTYQWQSSLTSNFSSPTNVGTGVTTYTPGNLTSPNNYYRVAVTSNGFTAYSAMSTITVYPVLQSGTITPSSQTINNGAAVTSLSLAGTTGGNGTYSYQWQSSPNNTFASPTNVGTGTTTLIPSNTNTAYYRVIVTSNGATATSASVLVTVYPVLDPGSITPTVQNIVSNTSAAGMIDDSVFGGSGTYTYQWQNSPNGSSWTNITNATGLSYSPGVLSSTTYYRLMVTSNGISMPTASSVVYVLQPGSISPATLSINNNTSPGQLSLTGVSGGNGSFSYQWQSSPINTFTSPTNVGTNATTYTPGNLSSLTYYRVGVTSNGFTAYSGISTINVYPPLQPGTIGPASQTINYNSLASLVSVTGVSGGNGVYTYQWQSSSSSGGPFTAISGAVGTGFRDDTGLTSTIYYRLLVTSNGVSLPTNAVVVNVYPQLQAGTISPATPGINNGTSPGQLTLSGVSGGNGTYTYQWQSSMSSNFSSPTNVGTNSTTFTPSNLTVTTYYRVGVTSNAVTNYSALSTVTVYAPLTAGDVTPPVFYANYNDGPGGVLTFNGVSGGDGNYVYQWQSSPDNTFSNPTDVGTNSPTFAPSGLTSSSYYYRVRVTSNGVTLYSTTSTKVNVYPQLLAGTISQSNTSIPANTSTGIMMDDEIFGGAGNYTYQWNRSSDGTTWTAIPGANLSQYSAILSATTYFTLTVGSNGSFATTPPVVVTVYQSVQPGTITPAFVTVEGGSSPGVLNGSTALQGGCGGSYVYEWQSSTDGNTYVGLGINSLNYSPSASGVKKWYRRKVTCGPEVAYTNPAVVDVYTVALAPGLNYVRTREVGKPDITDATTVNQSTDPYTVKTTTQYVDGLGRPSQTISKQASPLGNDMANLQLYDSYGRETIHDLPYTSPSSSGNYKPYPMSEQRNFNSTQFPSDQYYYGQTDYEASPLNRTINTFAPGNSWVGSARGVNTQYLVNAGSEVMLFSYDAATGLVSLGIGAAAYYSPGQLSKTTTIDEQQNEVTGYVDKLGRTVCKKVKASATEYACTYYLYDDVGNLMVVLPPEAVKKFAAQL